MNNQLTPYGNDEIEIIKHPEEIPDDVPSEDWTMVREWLRSKRSPHTRKAYKHNINVFYLYVNRKSMRFITLTDLQDYADTLAMKYPEPATQAQMLATVKSLLTFGQKMGYLQFNTGTAIQLPQGKDKLAERILEVSQIHAMIYETKKNGSDRDYAMILLLYGSGIRCSELCNLQWKDVQSNRNGGQITVLGKRNKTRSIPLHPKVWEALQSYKPPNFQLNDYVFQSRQTSTRNDIPSNRLTESRVWQIISSIAESAGINGVSPHWLRHTHATMALEKNAPLKLLQETLGHTSLAVTGRYTHVRPETSSSMFLDF